MAGKRYYWIKLKEDFFNSKRIKKLRRMAGGDTYVIIYLKMQLKAIKTDGMLKYTGLEDSFAEELALDIDESPDDVKMTLMYLVSCGLVESSDDVNFFIPFALENTGSEGSSAQRMRELRKHEASQIDAHASHCAKMCAHSDGEIEIEKEIDKRDRNIKAKADAFTEFASDDAELLKALKGFEAMRKAKKKPLTDKAKDMLLNKLKTFPKSDWVAILNQSEFNCWQGIFALDKSKSNKRTSFDLSEYEKMTNTNPAYVFDEV